MLPIGDFARTERTNLDKILLMPIEQVAAILLLEVQLDVRSQVPIIDVYDACRYTEFPLPWLRIKLLYVEEWPIGLIAFLLQISPEFVIQGCSQV